MAECGRCGLCCLSDFIAYVSDEDIDRWKKERRDDILQYLETHQWAGDRIISASGPQVKRCVFLEQAGKITRCTIYETRPVICRNFDPGSSPICCNYGKNE